MRCWLEGFWTVDGIDKESCGLQVARVLVGNRQRQMRGSLDSLRSLRMTSVNRQRQEQMRGFFPFTTLRVRMTNKNRMTSVNRQRQRQEPMRGFFPFTTLRVRMTNKNRMTSVNRQRQRQMRGSFDSLRSLRMTSVNRQRQEQMRGPSTAVGMMDHRMHDPTHAMRPHEWGTRICGRWGSRLVTHSSHKTQAR
jgi:hypothetical protein